MNTGQPAKLCAFCEAEIPSSAKKCRFCGEWVAGEPVGPSGATGPGELQSLVPRQRRGSLLSGRYRLTRLLGRGGMAEVWAAKDEKRNEAPVAIKMLPPAVMADSRSARALADEANLVMALHHENIRAVHNIEEGRDSRGRLRPFLVMELVDGLSLDDARAERPSGRLMPREVAGIGAQICDALEYAHGLGVIHRDLKPQNIFLAGLNADDLSRIAELGLSESRIRVKVTDFGLAVRVRASVIALSGVSVEVAGTFLYMPPEQLLGRKLTSDLAPRLDLYALGATLYELLSGHTLVSPDGDVAAQILHSDPELIDGCPSWLWDVIAACLAKRAHDRPAGAAVVARALRTGSAYRAVVHLRGGSNAASLPGGRTEERGQSRPEVVTPHSRGLAGWRPLPRSHRFFPVKPHPRQIEDAQALGLSLAIEHEVTGLAMVLVPRGVFMMGAIGPLPLAEALSRGEAQRSSSGHRVAIERAFYAGVTPVTVAEYLRYLRLTRREAPRPPSFNLGWKREGHPIVNVTWGEAKGFCEWAEARLPSDEEWEYAARGGLEAKRFPWGDERPSNQLGAPVGAQYCSDETATVASFGANGFGLYDLAGNAWEWVEDAWNEGDDERSKSGDSLVPHFTRRVVRGGSWKVGTTVRVTLRAGDLADDGNPYTGFRCFRDVGETAWGTSIGRVGDGQH